MPSSRRHRRPKLGRRGLGESPAKQSRGLLGHALGLRRARGRAQLLDGCRVPGPQAEQQVGGDPAARCAVRGQQLRRLPCRVPRSIAGIRASTAPRSSGWRKLSPARVVEDLCGDQLARRATAAVGLHRRQLGGDRQLAAVAEDRHCRGELSRLGREPHQVAVDRLPDAVGDEALQRRMPAAFGAIASAATSAASSETRKGLPRSDSGTRRRTSGRSRRRAGARERRRRRRRSTVAAAAAPRCIAGQQLVEQQLAALGGVRILDRRCRLRRCGRSTGTRSGRRSRRRLDIRQPAERGLIHPLTDRRPRRAGAILHEVDEQPVEGPCIVA